MHRFFLDPSPSTKNAIELSGAEAHHALHVLRVRPNDQILLLDGVGGRRRALVTTVSRSVLSARIVAEEQIPKPSPAITLMQAIAKPRAMDWIVQKATELGVARIVPILSERVVPHFSTRDARRKQEKWRQIQIEALKQCGNAWLPDMALPVHFEEALALGDPPELALVGSLAADAPFPRTVLRDFVAAASTPPLTVSLWIGPEGDFTPAEFELLARNKVQPFSLGTNVLRCDTAAVAALAILIHECRTLPASAKRS